MTLYRKGDAGKADRLFAELVRSRGRCERCGSTLRLECAHIISRRYNATTHDERNAWCLCNKCHQAMTHRHEEHMAFVRDTIGMDAYWELYRKAQAGVKVSKGYWLAEIERLKAHLDSGVV